MKYIFSIFQLFTVIFCQAQLYEGFDDGDFSQNPDWHGDTNAWEALNNELHSNSQTPNQTFYLQTASNTIQATQWELDIKLEFNTSSTNYVDIYLVASQPDLTSYQKGYFVRIGGTSDEISLYRKDSLNIVKIIDGKDSRTSSASNHIKLKIWKNTEHLWTLFSDSSFTGKQFYKEGETKDSTYLTSKYFGISVKQSTSSFFGKHFFDNIIISPYLPDTSPPLLSSIEIVNPSQIDLKFNESIDFNISSKNFRINASAPDSIQKGKTSSELSLFLNYAFQSGSTYHLQIDSLKDEFQNIQTKIDTQFSYFLPKFKDIRITEFLPDPSPIIGLPDAEFIEIWNASSENISLGNWKISDNSSSFAKLPDVVIKPNEYLILCNEKDTPLFVNFGKTIGLTNFPNLNNDMDEIRLHNSRNEIIDSLYYNQGFYHHTIKKDGGWSIELINPNYPCTNIKNNYSASIHTNGGTPGKINSRWDTSLDTAAPKLVSIEIISPEEILLVFDSEIDSISLTNAMFLLSENTVFSVKIFTVSTDSVLLKLKNTQPYDLQKSILLTIDSISDCWGNTSKNIQKNFIHFLPSSPKFSEIIITEIMADPDPVLGLPNAEYIEIYNTTDLPLQLQDIDFMDASLPKFVLEPKSYALITSISNSNNFPDSIQKIGLSNFPSLSNSGQNIYLISQNSEIIHRVSYENDWHSNGIARNGGWSLEVKDLSAICQGRNNWGTSKNPDGGTPGYTNSVNGKIPAENPPELIRVYPNGNNELWLYFDKIIFPNSFQKNDFTVNLSIGNPYQASYLDNTQQNLKLNFANLFLPGKIYSVEISQIHGCLDSNVSLQKMDFGLLRLADSNDITINEILFNPFPNGVDFVEIYNKTGDFLDLKNVWIANADLNANVKDFSPIASEGLMLLPHQYLAITENPYIVKTQYPHAITQNLWQVNSLPAYNDDEGTCILTTQNLTEFDRFQYFKEIHHPSIENDEGISLEKINPFENNTASFWTSASTLVNATPGYQNSQFMKLNLAKGSFSLSSPSVSPDGDGYEDVVYFQYKMPTNGYNGTIEIFDIHGIRKRTLINNELLATEGNIMFDGADNYGVKLTPGIYPIYFSFYNTEGNVEKIKSSIVVAVKF